MIVVDTTPPTILCFTNFIRTAGFGDTNRVVEFPFPPASDNCPGATLTVFPASGSTFPLGTSTVTCTAVDASQNTNICAFPLIVLKYGRVTNDLAIVKLTPPKTVTLSARVPSATKRVVVQIQNRGPHSEVISNATVLANLVSLNVQLLGSCPSITPVLVPPSKFPITLRSLGKLSVVFNAMFDCANDRAKGAGHEDFLYTAALHHEAIDGQPDGHPDDDVAPRGPLPHGIDPNPNGRIKDFGVGAKNIDGTLGGDILTDVVLK